MVWLLNQIFMATGPRLSGNFTPIFSPQPRYDTLTGTSRILLGRRSPMGIYDRDYYRDDRRSYWNRMIPEGGVCKFLIGAQVVVFVLQFLGSADPGGGVGLSGWLALQPSLFFQ